MLHKKSFVRKTRRGNVVKVVREHYLRDDIWCGIPGCTLCGGQQAPRLLLLSNQTDELEEEGYTLPFYALLHDSVLLHQVDFLEHPAVKNVIIAQSSLERLRAASIQAYRRLRSAVADADRHIHTFSNEHHRATFVPRTADVDQSTHHDLVLQRLVQWYSKHAQDGSGAEVRLILNTEPSEEQQEKLLQDCKWMTLEAYTELLTDKHPELADLVVSKDVAVADSSIHYPEYKSLSEIQKGVLDGEYVQGVIHYSQMNCLEAFLRVDAVSHKEGEAGEGVQKVKDEEEILIHGLENLNRAVDSDIVAVRILPESQWRAPSTYMLDNENTVGEQGEEELDEAELEKRAEAARIVQQEAKLRTGEVVGIIRRKWKPCCGTLLPPRGSNGTPAGGPGSDRNKSASMLFLPVDRRLPKIRIRTRQAAQLLDKLIVVAIDDWPRTSRYPVGHYVKQIGKKGEKETEMEALLVQYDIPYHPFSDSVNACLPSMPWTITEADVSKRKDLRHLLVASIDPEGCTDIDDALHVRKIANSPNYEIGVHIADVTHFVRSGTAIDEEAAVRGNTVYLSDRRIDMLPKLLGENLCSLRSDGDRFAFSVMWEIDPESVEIVNVSFAKSIIRSRNSFSYGEAQLRIDDPSRQDEMTKNLRLLNKFAKVLRQRRMDRGALTLASPEVRFKRTVTEDGEASGDVVDGPELYEMKETNALVEEFMLLANTTVAKKIYAHFPHVAVLRRHPAPPPVNFETLQRVAKLRGIDIDTDTSRALAESLDSAKFDDPYLDTLLRIMATRSMLQARYFCSGTVPESDFFHYGLAEPIYTHFTSPIRRYADVMVHRLLAAAIGLGSETSTLNVQAVTKITDVVNQRHRAAQQAARDSNQLFTAMFFKDKPTEAKGYVTRVRANAFTVLVPKFGFEHNVFVCGLNEENFYELDEVAQVLQHREDPALRVSLFQVVRVHISVDTSHVHRLRVVLKCLEPAIPLPKSQRNRSLPATAMEEDNPSKQLPLKRICAAESDSSKPAAPEKKKKSAASKKRQKLSLASTTAPPAKI